MSNIGIETAVQNTANNPVTAPAAATSNAASIIEQKEPLTTSASRRRAPSAPIWNCLTAARRMFNNLPSALQSTETKRMCLKEAAERTYGDPKRASYDIRNEARKLTNLLDFGEYCRKSGLKGESVAEHVVFEGKTVMRRVMEYGVESVLGTKIEMFAESLTDDRPTEVDAREE